MSTTIYKDIRNNWHAETHIPLEGIQQLRISTWKTDSGDLQSFASVCKVENGYVTHMIHQDYSRRVIVNRVRCTEKAVREQHKQAIALLPKILEDIAQHDGQHAAA